MHIAAISFDGDMTLWDFQKVMRHALKHALKKLQKNVPTKRAQKLTIENLILIRDQLAEEAKGKFWKLEQIRRVAFERTLQKIGSPNQELAEHYRF